MKLSLPLAAVLAVSACVKHPGGTPSPPASVSQNPEWPPFDTGLNSGQALTEKISGILAECKNIKPGMTRGQVERIFTMDGGLQDLFDSRYVYRRCPVVKIQIKFAPPDGKKGMQPNDVVTGVSKPYLEPQFVD